MTRLCAWRWVALMVALSGIAEAGDYAQTRKFVAFGWEMQGDLTPEKLKENQPELAKSLQGFVQTRRDTGRNAKLKFALGTVPERTRGETVSPPGKLSIVHYGPRLL